MAMLGLPAAAPSSSVAGPPDIGASAGSAAAVALDPAFPHGEGHEAVRSASTSRVQRRIRCKTPSSGLSGTEHEVASADKQAGHSGIGDGGPSIGVAGVSASSVVLKDGVLIRPRRARQGEQQESGSSNGADAAGVRRGRIVTGFGPDRVEDIAAKERRLIAEGARRGDERRNEGTRGRVTNLRGEDIDRGAR